ncbi:MAG: EAL domain-containing protein [Rubrivivax sp.]
MESGLHLLLQQQLRELTVDPADGAACASVLPQLLSCVSAAYAKADDEQQRLRQAQHSTSHAMGELNTALQIERDQLEARVHERTDALKLSEQRLHSLVSLSSDWVWEQDAKLCFSYFSDGLQRATGTDPRELLGRPRRLSSENELSAEALSDYTWRVATRQPFRNLCYRLQAGSARKLYISVSGEPIFDAQGLFAGYRGIGRDITQQHLAEQQAHMLARYDELTGLPNRSMFIDELERTLTRARRHAQSFALCFIDLDRFKTINDSLGHAAGDRLLQTMAHRLRALLRESDLVARLGGDEFVVLVEGDVSTVALGQVARKALEAMAEPIDIEGRCLHVSGSIGISRYPDDGLDAAALLKTADAAMYLAKGQGKNTFQFHTAELAAHSAQQFALETDLRSALQRDELLLHYQPKVNIADGRMVGMEALLRWQHPQRGLLGPGEFIALAEDSGLIVPIGLWVMAEACRQIRRWRDAGFDVPRCAINLSARQFGTDTLVADVLQALQQQRLTANVLEVEITESLLMSDPQRASRTLQELYGHGVHIAIDDFGTGYSSLAYLKRFPAQTVKLDRSFVKGLPHDRDDAAITQAVVAMAHHLGIGVVAEGVETQDQFDMLRSLGCDEAQGYLIDRPLAAAQLASRLLLAAPARPSSVTLETAV